MGTKRIGRVGERDGGFHSNGALPSALSCCHYGSEVFRSCRKQSYGKPAGLDSSPACFFFFFLSLLIRPSLTSSAHPADVMWSQPQRCGLRQFIMTLSVVSVSLSPFFLLCFRILDIYDHLSSRKQNSVYFICPPHCHICFLFLFLNAPFKTKNECCPSLCFSGHRLHFCGLSFIFCELPFIISFSKWLPYSSLQQGYQFMLLQFHWSSIHLIILTTVCSGFFH